MRSFLKKFLYSWLNSFVCSSISNLEEIVNRHNVLLKYGLNKIYKSFSIDNIGDAVNAVRTLDIKGFAITMPYKVEVLDYVDELAWVVARYS